MGSVPPVRSIYGANASGKSNVLKALDFANSFVVNFNKRQVEDTTGITPFKLNKSCLSKPSI